MNTQHTPLVVSYDESGGYDCMTAAFGIHQGDRTLAKLDLADYGQHNCKPPPPSAIMEARAYAELFAASRELLAALLKAETWVATYIRVEKLEEGGLCANDLAEIRAAIAKATSSPPANLGPCA